MKKHVLTLCALIALVAPVQAQTTQNLPPSITVVGTGRAFAKPDLVQIQSGVTTQGATAAAALAANNTAMAELLATLKKFGIEDRDVLTSNFSVNPEYGNMQPYSGGGRPQRPKIVSYRVDNSVHLKIRDIKKLGPLLDALVQSGANNVNSINFTVAEPDPIVDKARASAIADARRKAQIYAESAGVKLGKVLYVTEAGGGMPPPMPRMMMAGAAMESSVPIASGETEMQTSVSVIFAIE
jgi:uncharacterized protein